MSEPTWELLGGGGSIGGPIDYVGDWAPGTAYQPGQVVRYAGVDYLAVNPSTGQVPPLASPVPISEVCLFDQVLLADAASIDIPNIPQVYKDLRLVVSLRSNQGGTTDHIMLRLNNDAGAVYWALATGWVGGSALNTYVSNGSVKGACGMAVGATGDAGAFGSSEILIPDYASLTKKKSWQAYSGSQYSAALNTTWALMYAGYWNALSAINRITISPNGGTLFVAGSRVTLYGKLAAGQAPPVTTLAPGGIGTAFPGSPTNGELFTLVDSLTAPTYAWDCRYVASIADANKWVFVGGDPKEALVLTDETRNVNTYGALATAHSMSVPRAGIYDVEIDFNFYADAGVVGAAAVDQSGGPAAADAKATMATGSNATSAAYAGSGYRKRRETLTANTLSVLYRGHPGAAFLCHFLNRRLAITPVRLS